MTAPQELLLIRLDTLDDDVGKVANAIERAKRRGDEINAVMTALGGEARDDTIIRPLRQLSILVGELGKVLRENTDMQDSIDEREGPDLLRRLAGADDEFDRIYDSLIEARDRLRT